MGTILKRLFYIAYTLLLVTYSEAQVPINWTIKKVSKYTNGKLEYVLTYDTNGNKLTLLEMNIRRGDTAEYMINKYNENNLLQSYCGIHGNGSVGYNFQEYKETWIVKSKIDGEYSNTRPYQQCGDGIIIIGETKTVFDTTSKARLNRTIYCLGRKPYEKALYQTVQDKKEFLFNEKLKLYENINENKKEYAKISDDTIIEYQIEYFLKFDMTYKWVNYYLNDVLVKTLCTNYKGKKMDFDENEQPDKERQTIIEYKYEYFE